MDDIIYIGAVVVFFVFTWGLLKVCEALQPEADRNVEEKSGGTV
jgi:hypothetical protein